MTRRYTRPAKSNSSCGQRMPATPGGGGGPSESGAGGAAASSQTFAICSGRIVYELESIRPRTGPREGIAMRLRIESEVGRGNAGGAGGWAATGRTPARSVATNQEAATRVYLGERTGTAPYRATIASTL